MDEIDPEVQDRILVRDSEQHVIGNGNGAAPPAPRADAPPVSYDPARSEAPQPTFWRNPVASIQNDVVWFHPPVPNGDHRRERSDSMVEELAGLLHQTPFRAWLLRWTNYTRSSAAQEELEHLERDTRETLAERRTRAEAETARLHGSLRELEDRQQAIERELESAEKAFADASARAGLIGAAPPRPTTNDQRRTTGESHDPTTPRPPKPFANPQSSILNPQWEVEQALGRTAPSAEALAGRYGIRPAHVEPGIGRQMLTGFLEMLARLVSGFLLALCLGTLVGLVNLDDLKRPDLRLGDYAPFIISAFLGFVIVYLMGEVYYNGVHSLKHSLDDRRAVEAAGHLPPLQRGALGFATLFLAVALTLGVSEVVAEAAGLRMLHQERIQANNLLNGTTEHLLPWILYALIGLLISGPYLLYKSTKAWNQGDGEVRHAWLLHQRDEWMAERRAQPDVQDAFRWAASVTELRAQRDALRARIDAATERYAQLESAGLTPAETQRLTDARAAAVGEAARLHQAVEQVVESHDPLPRKAPPVAAGPPAARHG